MQDDFRSRLGVSNTLNNVTATISTVRHKLAACCRVPAATGITACRMVGCGGKGDFMNGTIPVPVAYSMTSLCRGRLYEGG